MENFHAEWQLASVNPAENLKTMKHNKTKKAFEKHLNHLYFDAFSESQAIDNFIYLTSKSRGQHCSENHLINCINRRELGSLLRRLDPIAFNVAYGDWRR